MARYAKVLEHYCNTEYGLLLLYVVLMNEYEYSKRGVLTVRTHLKSVVLYSVFEYGEVF